jgi:hypothetical protein
MKRNKKKEPNFLLITSCLLLISVAFHFPSIANADTLSNGNYSIDVGNIDTNPQPTQIQKKQPQILGISTPQPEFTTGTNYTVNTSNDSFSINVLQNTVDYGILSSTNPVIRTSGISFSDPKFGAEILTYENHPLESAKNDNIQNTSCDNGDCSSFIAAVWTNTLTYGFGYRCDSQDPTLCDPQFANSNYFKQYPEDSLNEPAEPLMISKGNTRQNKAVVTYKVNIPGTQKVTAYYNSITYLAIPGF